MDDVIKEARPRGNHVTTYRDKDGKEIEVKLQIKFEKIVIKPSYGPKTKIFPDLEVVVIRAKEISNSGGSREPMNWWLITNLPVSDLSDAIEKLEWYPDGCRTSQMFLYLALEFLQRRCFLLPIHSQV